MRVIEHPGAGVAPWNQTGVQLSESRDAQGRAFDLAQVMNIQSSSLLMNVDEMLALLQKNLRQQGYMDADRDFAAMLIQCQRK